MTRELPQSVIKAIATYTYACRHLDKESRIIREGILVAAIADAIEDAVEQYKWDTWPG